MGTSWGAYEINHEWASIFVYRRQSRDSFRIEYMHCFTRRITNQCAHDGNDNKY